MKLKLRLVFCVLVVCVLGPFLWLRSLYSDEVYPLVTENLDEPLEFSRIDLRHNDKIKRTSKSNNQKSDLERSENAEKPTSKKKRSASDKDEKEDSEDTVDAGDYEFNDPWQLWTAMVKNRQLTSKGDRDNDDVSMIVEAMAYKPIVAAGIGYRGTQLKATLILEGNQKVVFKPMRYPRDHVINGKPYDGFDRHNGEIAAFHLDRILEFYRAPPVVGRRVNLAEEIEPIGEKRLLDTFFKEDGNTCFYGVCHYCKKSEAACANDTIMEGSITIWLPSGWSLSTSRHPWQRTYREGRKAHWEIDNNYCQKVTRKSPYDSGPRLLDIIDTAVFDFLIGNADRHHYETFKKDGDEGMLLHLDNAKSFGNPHHDEISILAPVYQCCRIRLSTWLRLVRLNKDKVEPLSARLRKAMDWDPVAPILTDLHLHALDRRLGIALGVVRKCIARNGKRNVLLKDNF